MFRTASAFTALAILLWVLPLGAFIASSQEKTACGGKRGMHMCSMMKAKSVSPDSVAFSNASSAERTAKSSASSGADEFSMETDLSAQAQAVSAHLLDIFSSSSLYFREIPAPPPRVTALR
jgi:hypothetical protein